MAVSRRNGRLSAFFVYCFKMQWLTVLAGTRNNSPFSGGGGYKVLPLLMLACALLAFTARLLGDAIECTPPEAQSRFINAFCLSTNASLTYGVPVYRTANLLYRLFPVILLFLGIILLNLVLDCPQMLFSSVQLSDVLKLTTCAEIDQLCISLIHKLVSRRLSSGIFLSYISKRITVIVLYYALLVLSCCLCLHYCGVALDYTQVLNYLKFHSFPIIIDCVYIQYGFSGSYEKREYKCVLPLNDIYRYMFIVLVAAAFLTLMNTIKDVFLFSLNLIPNIRLALVYVTNPSYSYSHLFLLDRHASLSLWYVITHACSQVPPDIAKTLLLGIAEELSSKPDTVRIL